MRDYFENHEHSDGRRAESAGSLQAEDWVRLEEVGDLHFHAFSFSSALDYYGQLIDARVLLRMPGDQAIRVLRKGVDSQILQGNLNGADLLIGNAEDVIDEQLDGDPDPSIVVQSAMIRSRKAFVLRERGQLDDALLMLKKSFSVLALTDEHAEVARLQVGMGICQAKLGNLEKAEELLLDGMSTFRRIDHQLGLVNVMNNLIILNKNRCEWDKALHLAEQAIDIARRVGASHLLPTLNLNQGIVLQKIGRLGEARTTLDRGLRIAQSLGAVMNITRLHLALGRTECLAGRLARAEELILEGQSLALQHGLRRDAAIADEYLGDIQLLRGDTDKACFNYNQGLEKNMAIGRGNDLEGELLRRLGEAHHLGGKNEEAIAVSQAAISVNEQCGEEYEIGFCHLTLGGAYGEQGDVRQSDFHYREAIDVFRRQRLTHHWCDAIIRYADSRLESAGEPELLLLRRYLMDAQADGAAAVSDRMLCRVLRRLAQTQVRLGQFDDALLTVFELERHAAGFEDTELDRAVVQLRNHIESGFVGGSRQADSNLKAIGELPHLVRGEQGAGPSNLASVLAFGMERVAADAGFIALVEGDADEMNLVARKGLTANLSYQLIHWIAQRTENGDSQATFVSRVDSDENLAAQVPALRTVADSCVFMPIASNGRVYGVLFLGKAPSKTDSRGFDRAALDFLGAYLGFLALLLFEQDRALEEVLPSEAPSRISNFESIITDNHEMLELLELARKVAPSDLTVLINGQTGTGKGLLAKSIHALSPRSTKKFLSINCAAIPETLLESELFGHVKGAFTGAHSDKKGLLAEAEGGTVFLDEIGKMPKAMQGKMLHFLDTRVVRPVGGNFETRVDVRIICASKLDLHDMGQKGIFLEDLYYRMLDFPLSIPPLRQRLDDVPLLVRHFIGRFCRETGAELPGVDAEFMLALEGYSWPGNVRELEKTLKRAMILAQSGGVLRVEHLPTAIAGTRIAPPAEGATTPLKETIAAIECVEIEKALLRTGWNKAAAARALGVSYPNLLNKIRHYGLRKGLRNGLK